MGIITDIRNDHEINCLIEQWLGLPRPCRRVGGCLKELLDPTADCLCDEDTVTPDYCNDFNLVYAAEGMIYDLPETLEGDLLRKRHRQALQEICIKAGWKTAYREYRASARQRAEALVMVFEWNLTHPFESAEICLKFDRAADLWVAERTLEIPKQELRSDRQLDRIIAEWRWGRIPYSDTSVSDTGPVYPRACKDPVACEEAEARMTDTERVHFVSMLTGDTPRHRAEALVKVIERYRKKERVSG